MTGWEHGRTATIWRPAPVVIPRGYLFVGFDPGLTGAIGMLEDIESEEVSHVYDMPLRAQGERERMDRPAIKALLQEAVAGRRLVAVVEAVGVRKKFGKNGAKRSEGAVGMLRFGQGQGEILGILEGLDALIFEVPPSVWKMKAGLVHMDEKKVCRLALKLFPGHVLFGPGGGAKHGRAEALFLAAYGRMLVEGKDIYAR